LLERDHQAPYRPGEVSKRDFIWRRSAPDDPQTI
jgi:hypothetical protein